MGATYTRQSTYSDGDTITSAHTNDEFDQLLAAFAASTGHTHDGTAGEGGPISTMAGHALTMGAGTSGTDIVITFDGETNDGVLKWMEDEDYFEFSDDLLIASTEKIQFRDTAIYINSSVDGQLDIVADTEIQIAATTIDINGNVDISGTLTIGSAGISEAELEILDGATVTTAELNILDGVTTTAAEINLIDGGTARGTTAVASGDGILINDAGTMRMTNVDTVSTYFSSHSVGGGNIVTTGALNSGSITSGFGTIDIGSSAFTTTGTVNFGSLADGTITITAFVDEDDMSTNSATLVPTQQSVKAYVDSQTSATTVTVTDSTANTNFPVVFHNESNGLLDDTGALRYNPSTGTLLAPNLVVSGTTTTVNTVTMEAENAVIFEGATADAYETTLSIVDPTADHTQYLINQGGYIPVLAAATTTQISSTPAELNILDGATVVVGEINALDLGATAVGTAIASKAVILDANKDYTGIRNLTLAGDLSISDAQAIKDNNGNEQIVFQTTSSAVNQLEITNAASSGNPIIAATGGDTNIGITLTPKGTGEIVIAAGNLNYGSTAVTSTGAELNLLDGGTSVGGSITVADADGFVVNDGGTMKTIPATDIKTYASGSSATKGFAIAMAIVFG